MAVQARRRLLPTGDADRGGGGGGGAAVMGHDAPPFLPGQASYGGGVGQWGYGSSYVGPVAAPAVAGAGLGQYSPFCCAPDAAESGVTLGGGCQVQEAASRKRRRISDQPPSVLGGAAEVAAHAQQQLVDVDRVILHHAAKMWVLLAEEWRRKMVAAVEAAAAKRLRLKDEEISRIGRLNWALEERLRSLFLEAQVWRDLAQSNEATANALRGELEQALEAQARRGGAGAGAGADGDDAESCCYGENDVAAANGDGENHQVSSTAAGTRGGDRAACWGCGKRAAVLLLPCRHLCACAPCAATARACPACGCAKNGTVCVNFP